VSQPRCRAANAGAPAALTLCSAAATAPVSRTSISPITVTRLRRPAAASSPNPVSSSPIRGGRKTECVAERHAGMPPDQRDRADLVRREPEPRRRLDVDLALQRADHLALGIQGQRHQLFDGAEVVDVPVLLGDRVGAPARHPVDDPLGHEVLHGPPDGLPADRVGRRELLFGGQLTAVGVLAVADGVPDLGGQGPVGDGSQLHDESMPRIDFGRTFVRKWPYNEPYPLIWEVAA